MEKLFSRHDWAGKVSTRIYKITPALIDQFVEISGDSSRLHCEDMFARARGFNSRVAHGALLVALASGVIGTEIPGDCGVLQNIEFTFHNPAYAGDEISVTVTASDFRETLQILFGTIVIQSASGKIIAKGKFRSGLRNEAHG